MATGVVLPAGMGRGACQAQAGHLGGHVFPIKGVLLLSCSLASPSPQQPVEDWGKEVSWLPRLHTKHVPLCSQHVPFMCSQTARCKALNQRGPVSPRESSSLGKSPGWGSQPAPTLQLPAEGRRRGGGVEGDSATTQMPLFPRPSFEVQRFFRRAELSCLWPRLTRAQRRVSLRLCQLTGTVVSS